MARAEQGPALLLRARPRSDDDQWLTLLNPDHGRLQVLAKHSRGSKRRFGTSLQAFHLFHAQWSQSASGLYLESATPLEQPLGAEPELSAMMAGWLFLELAEKVCHPGQPQAALFEMVLSAMRRLGKGSEGPGAVRLSLLWGVLGLEGWAPDLAQCARCGSKGPWKAAVLNATAGGLLCPLCARVHDGVAVSQATVARWQAALEGRPVEGVEGQDEAPVLRWIEHHLGAALQVATVQTHALGALS